MKRLLRRLLGGPPGSAGATAPFAAPLDLYLVPGAAVPVPDWDRVEAELAPRLAEWSPDELWSAAARQWLGELATWAGAGFQVIESEHFLALSGQSPRIARATLAWCEKSRGRILRLLQGIAADDGFGKPCVLVFDDAEGYYRYVAHYYPEAGEYALSSGLFIDRGYGHFVLGQNDLNAIEPVIAHELTHLHLAHLPLPAWLNEGLAVNVEMLLAPRGCGRRVVRDATPQHLAYWNAHSIQRFWSGEAFLRNDAGNALAYDLAARLTRLLGEDRAAFVGFANAAHAEDGGEAAARRLNGTGLCDCVTALLGEGDWAPRPERWPAPVAKARAMVPAP